MKVFRRYSSLDLEMTSSVVEYSNFHRLDVIEEDGCLIRAKTIRIDVIKGLSG